MVGSTETASVILSALRKLEYRGYDSAGMATLIKRQIENRKGIGKLADVEKNYHLSGAFPAQQASADPPPIAIPLLISLL